MYCAQFSSFRPAYLFLLVKVTQSHMETSQNNFECSVQITDCKCGCAPSGDSGHEG